MSCIQSYGLFVPETRLKVDDLAAFYGLPHKSGVEALAVPQMDEDTVTMGFEAAKTALQLGGISPQEVGALVWGSMSPPFGKKSVGVLLARALNLRSDIISLDFNSGTKLVTEALLAADSLIEANQVEKVLLVCSDFIPEEGREALRLPSSAAAAALVLSREGFARFTCFSSYQSEVYDFWQVKGEERSRHDPEVYLASYLEAVTISLQNLFSKAGISPEKICGLAVHVPSVRAGARLLKKLGKMGWAEERLEGVLTVARRLGNLSSPSLLFGLFQALERASAGDLIAAASYGSGSSEALLVELSDNMPEGLKSPSLLTAALDREQAITLAQYQELSKV